MTPNPDTRTIDRSDSVIGRAIQRARTSLSSAANASLVLGAGRRALDWLETSAANSGLAGIGRFLGKAIRNSWIFRWLTAEPDPTVIVIDLRETWIVGPIIRLLDWFLERLTEIVPHSRLYSLWRTTYREFIAAPLRVFGLVAILVGSIAIIQSILMEAGPSLEPSFVVALVLVASGTLALRDDRSWETLRETRAVEALVALLVPPEPHDSTDTNESTSMTDSSDPEEDAEFDKGKVDK